MGNITKKKLKKHFKDVHKKTRKKKSLAKQIEEHVKVIALKQAGEDGTECVVINNVSIEISTQDSSSVEPGADNPEAMVASSSTSDNCYYYCYVIGGTRICRKLWCD
jgi:hypothetical protein